MMAAWGKHVSESLLVSSQVYHYASDLHFPLIQPKLQHTNLTSLGCCAESAKSIWDIKRCLSEPVAVISLENNVKFCLNFI